MLNTNVINHIENRVNSVCIEATSTDFFKLVFMNYGCYYDNVTSHRLQCNYFSLDSGKYFKYLSFVCQKNIEPKQALCIKRLA